MMRGRTSLHLDRVALENPPPLATHCRHLDIISGPSPSTEYGAHQCFITVTDSGRTCRLCDGGGCPGAGR
jgi:hypothetical protein